MLPGTYQLVQQLAQEVAELGAAVIVRGSANGPDDAEHKVHVQQLGEVLGGHLGGEKGWGLSRARV